MTYGYDKWHSEMFRLRPFIIFVITACASSLSNLIIEKLHVDIMVVFLT